MENKNSERLVYASDLLYSLLYGWKTILVCILIFAVLLGGLHIAQGVSGAADSPESAAAMEDYEEDKLQLSHRVELLESNVERQQDYIDSALVMQLNPFSHYQLSVRYYVDAGSQAQQDLAGSLLDAYGAILTGGESLQLLAEALELDVAYLTGAVSAPVVENSNVLTVKIVAPDQAVLLTAQPVLEQRVAAVQAQLEQSIGHHQLRPVDAAITHRVDNTFVTIQTSHINQLKQLQSQYEEAQAQLEAMEPPLVQLTNVNSALKSTVKRIVLGAVVGLFLGALLVCLRHICSRRVYSCRTLENQTSVKIIGAIALPQGRGIAKAVQRWEGRSTNDPGKQAGLLAVSIRNRCEKISRLLLTGDGDCQALQKALAQAMPNVQVEVAGDILRDAQALEALAKAEAVVLVEQCAVSSYRDVSRRMELIQDHETKLLGCVLYGG